MIKNDFLATLRARTTEFNAERIATALGDELIAKLHFLKDGSAVSVFEIDDSNLVLKICNEKRQENLKITSSRFMPYKYYRQSLSDETHIDTNGKSVRVKITIEPQLTHDGVTRLHQEMLRYKLWTEEGVDFWDILPARSYPKEIKNVLLDHRGVPYQIDDDAVKPFKDTYGDYPPDGDGKRTDAQYLQYRADSFNQYGNPDVIPAGKFSEIVAACKRCDWPVNQKKIFDDYMDQATLQHFKQALNSLASPPAFAMR